MFIRNLALIAATATLLAAGPALLSPAFASPSTRGADDLRQMDIMLMVTGARCQATTFDFRNDYARFARTHSASLNGARHAVRSALVHQYGATRGAAAFERQNAAIANRYRDGHPWLDCAQLRQVTRQLVEVYGRATLVEAADQLVHPRQNQRLAAAQL